MKSFAILAGLVAVVTAVSVSSADASTLRASIGSTTITSSWSRMSQRVSGVLPSIIGHRWWVAQDGSSRPAASASASGVSCISCERQSSALPESATMILLGTVLLGTSFAARRLGKTHP
jgi:hypothetical protein